MKYIVAKSSVVSGGPDVRPFQAGELVEESDFNRCQEGYFAKLLAKGSLQPAAPESEESAGRLRGEWDRFYRNEGPRPVAEKPVARDTLSDLNQEMNRRTEQKRQDEIRQKREAETARKAAATSAGYPEGVVGHDLHAAYAPLSAALVRAVALHQSALQALDDWWQTTANVPDADSAAAAAALESLPAIGLPRIGDEITEATNAFVQAGHQAWLDADCRWRGELDSIRAEEAMQEEMRRLDEEQRAAEAAEAARLRKLLSEDPEGQETVRVRRLLGEHPEKQTA